MLRGSRRLEAIPKDRYPEPREIRDAYFDTFVSILNGKLDIENPQAHRALADALTIARVYLELKKKGSSEKEVVIDDLLADIDDRQYVHCIQRSIEAIIRQYPFKDIICLSGNDTMYLQQT